MVKFAGKRAPKFRSCDALYLGSQDKMVATACLGHEPSHLSFVRDSRKKTYPEEGSNLADDEDLGPFDAPTTKR